MTWTNLSCNDPRPLICGEPGKDNCRIFTFLFVKHMIDVEARLHAFLRVR